MKYKTGDTVKVINSDTLVIIRGTRGNDYFIGQFWEHEHPPKYSYRIGSSLYIKEHYLEDFVQQYKKGDKVWYLDLSTEVPKIKQDVVVRGGYTCELQNYRENLTGGLIVSSKIYLTKEALLAAIDPPLHNFTVGQDLWYVEDEDDDWGLRVEKGIVTQTTDESVTLSVANGIATVKLEIDKYHVFDNPQDAVTKALELKQW